MSSARILIIDDDPNARAALVHTLESKFHVTTAVSRNQCVQRIITVGAHFDVLVIDMQAPGMSGIEVTRAVRALRTPAWTAEVPIIMLTRGEQPADLLAALQAGATAFLAKPVTGSALIDVIEDCCLVRTA
jgi:CheY-like chemotaxis protein